MNNLNFLYIFNKDLKLKKKLDLVHIVLYFKLMIKKIIKLLQSSYIKIYSKMNKKLKEF